MNNGYMVINRIKFVLDNTECDVENFFHAYFIYGVLSYIREEQEKFYYNKEIEYSVFCRLEDFIKTFYEFNLDWYSSINFDLGKLNKLTSIMNKTIDYYKKFINESNSNEEFDIESINLIELKKQVSIELQIY